MNNNYTSRLKIAKINDFSSSRQLTLYLVFEREYRDGRIEEWHFPRVVPNIDTECFDTETDDAYDIMNRKIDATTFIKFGFERLELLQGEVSFSNGDKLDRCCYAIKTIREPETKEMTIAELEKELGYKIKIVKEKSDD